MFKPIINPYKILVFLLIGIFASQALQAQHLKLPRRKANALSGKAFALSIADSSLSLVNREQIIYQEIKKGNVPDFLRTLKKVQDTAEIVGLGLTQISYYVLPDYFAIGSNEDFFYIPMTPILAQKVVRLCKGSLPTKKMVDRIYQQAKIKLEPSPIPPTKAMTTVPAFIKHNEIVNMQLSLNLKQHNNGELTAGNKKDVIISNKIYGEKTSRVVIYGWHKLDGKAIQPVYNKHTNTWADYSHGIRMVQNKVWINDKKTTLQKVLADPNLSILLSDEGIIGKAYYPIFKSY